MSYLLSEAVSVNSEFLFRERWYCPRAARLEREQLRLQLCVRRQLLADRAVGQRGRFLLPTAQTYVSKGQWTRDRGQRAAGRASRDPV